MDNEQINRAYIAGLKLKHSGLSEEVIYARLEKQGFEETLARKVARDVMIENEREAIKEHLDYGLMVGCIGLAFSVISYFLFDNFFIVCTGAIIGGFGLAWFAKNKLNK
jgi:hypothetical protein